jgi:hypothetical protein
VTESAGRSASRADDPRIPLTSHLLGFGPMLPLAVAALGAWVGPGGWPYSAVRLAIIWAALILAFVGGVRRGFGFGQDRASTAAEIAAAALYLFSALAALVAPTAEAALGILVAAYVLAVLLDRRAAVRGDAPRHFARLRPPQLLLGAASLGAVWAWVHHLGTLP